MCTELLCPLCNTSTFSDIDSFRYNLIKVNSKPLKCPLCFETFLGLDKLTIHLFAHSLPPEEDIKEILQHNDQSQTLPSSSLSKKISSSPAPTKVKQNRVKIVKMTSLASAAATSQEENFRCEICGFVFVDEQLLNLHLNLVHNFTPCGSGGASNDNSKQSLSQPSSPKGCVGNEGVLAPEGGMKWNCHLCGKHFKMKGALRIHIRVAHVRFHDQNQKQINIADYLKSQKSSAIDLCTIKTELLSLQDPHSPSDNSLQQQQRFYAASSSPTYPSPAITPTTAAIVSAQSPSHCTTQQESVAKNSSKIFQCEECKKTFTTKYFLKKHKRLHTGEMPYKCDVEGCGKMFHFQQSYHKHLLYHTDSKPYECNECGRSFKELSTLHNHQRIHSGIKPFGCHVCGKFFRQKVSYLVHQRIHNGLLPYKCSECGKGFRYKVSQRSHKCSGSLLERKPGDLIQKLMQNSSILPPQSSSSSPPLNSPSSTITTIKTVTSNDRSHMATETVTSTHELGISIANQHEDNDAETHDLCLDDLLKESFEKIMKSQLSPSLQIIPTPDNAFETSTISQTTFGNNSSMAINSHYNNNELTTTAGLTNNNATTFHINYLPLETISEDSIKELLYSHIG